MCFEKHCSFSGLKKMPNLKMKFRKNYLASNCQDIAS